MRVTQKDLDQLRRLAAALVPNGPWKSCGREDLRPSASLPNIQLTRKSFDDFRQRERMVGGGWLAWGEYVAALSPDVLLSLLDHIAELESELDPSVCSLQLPDGRVPVNVNDAAQSWHDVAMGKDHHINELEYRLATAEASLADAAAARKLIKNVLENVEAELASTRDTLLLVEQELSAQRGARVEAEADLALARTDRDATLRIIADRLGLESEMGNGWYAPSTILRRIAEWKLDRERAWGEAESLRAEHDFDVDTAEAKAAALAGVRAERDALADALETLMDLQNGAPLPSYERGWDKAMKTGRELIAKFDAGAAKGGEQP